MKYLLVGLLALSACSTVPKREVEVGQCYRYLGLEGRISKLLEYGLIFTFDDKKLSPDYYTYLTFYHLSNRIDCVRE